MEKNCFILLPLSEPEGYAKGHFNRVYQYIIAPACRQAGLSPQRVGDPSIDDTPLGIVNTLIESDLVICDISANDTHALYCFAIRQALGLPVTLVKDLKTNVKANIPEFEIVEYDESLRIDTVENEVPSLSEALKKSIDTNTTPNYILTQLNIETAAIPEEIITPVTFEPASSSETSEEENRANQIPLISPIPDYVGDPLTQHEIEKMKVGDFFFHMNYGKGEILSVNHKTKDILAKIQFDSGTKILVLMPTHIFRKIIK
jgi:hypothetical protein